MKLDLHPKNKWSYNSIHAQYNENNQYAYTYYI